VHVLPSNDFEGLFGYGVLFPGYSFTKKEVFMFEDSHVHYPDAPSSKAAQALALDTPCLAQPGPQTQH
jgi:hypothetical protein